jgi:hypothetical protein
MSQRVRVDVRAGWALDDGTARYVVALNPTPSVAWERAFGEFERTAYTPSPARPRIRHGAIALVCAPDDLETEAAALERRLRLFASSQVG